MRRDLPVQVIVDYGDVWENFATPFEAEQFINANLDELDVPVSVRLEDMHGHLKWTYDVVEDDAGLWHLIQKDPVRPRLVRNPTN